MNKLDVAIKTLEEIADPISAMRNNLKEGERLDGRLAVQLSNDPNYLKDIARKALSVIAGR